MMGEPTKPGASETPSVEPLRLVDERGDGTGLKVRTKPEARDEKAEPIDFTLSIALLFLRSLDLPLEEPVLVVLVVIALELDVLGEDLELENTSVESLGEEADLLQPSIKGNFVQRISAGDRESVARFSRHKSYSPAQLPHYTSTVNPRHRPW